MFILQSRETEIDRDYPLSSSLPQLPALTGSGRQNRGLPCEWQGAEHASHYLPPFRMYISKKLQLKPEWHATTAPDIQLMPNT